MTSSTSKLCATAKSVTGVQRTGEGVVVMGCSCSPWPVATIQECARSTRQLRSFDWVVRRRPRPRHMLSCAVRTMGRLKAGAPAEVNVHGESGNGRRCDGTDHTDGDVASTGGADRLVTDPRAPELVPEPRLLGGGTVGPEFLAIHADLKRPVQVRIEREMDGSECE